MKKKKILFVMDTMVLGGSQKVLLNCLALFKNKYDVELLLLNNYGIYLSDIPEYINVKFIFSKYKQVPLNEINKFSNLEKFKILFYKFFFRGGIYLSYLKFKSNHIIKKDDYHYIIGFQEGPSNFVAANIKTNAVKIGWLHSDINRLTKVQTKMECGVYEKLNHIICVSDFVKNEAINKYPEIASKIRVLYNPIDTDIIHERACEPLLGIDKKKINLISIGRLSPEKNFLLLIENLYCYLLANPNVILNIVGDGPEKSAIISKIEDKGVSSQVVLHGYQKNPYKYLFNSDIYVSASEYEGLPTTILEAMILGKRIIANRIPSNVELLENYPLALLINIKDKVELQYSIYNALALEGGGDITDINMRISCDKFVDNFELAVKN